MLPLHVSTIFVVCPFFKLSNICDDRMNLKLMTKLQCLHKKQSNTNLLHITCSWVAWPAKSNPSILLLCIADCVVKTAEISGIPLAHRKPREIWEKKGNTRVIVHIKAFKPRSVLDVFTFRDLAANFVPPHFPILLLFKLLEKWQVSLGLHFIAFRINRSRSAVGASRWGVKFKLQLCNMILFYFLPIFYINSDCLP